MRICRWQAGDKLKPAVRQIWRMPRTQMQAQSVPIATFNATSCSRLAAASLCAALRLCDSSSRAASVGNAYVMLVRSGALACRKLRGPVPYRLRKIQEYEASSDLCDGGENVDRDASPPNKHPARGFPLGGTSAGALSERDFGPRRTPVPHGSLCRRRSRSTARRSNRLPVSDLRSTNCTCAGRRSSFVPCRIGSESAPC